MKLTYWIIVPSSSVWSALAFSRILVSRRDLVKAFNCVLASISWMGPADRDTRCHKQHEQQTGIWVQLMMAYQQFYTPTYLEAIEVVRDSLFRRGRGQKWEAIIYMPNFEVLSFAPIVFMFAFTPPRWEESGRPTCYFIPKGFSNENKLWTTALIDNTCTL